MYTAPKRFTEDDLNERIPLSIAQWHEHVNFCRAAREAQARSCWGPNPKFGLRGSITTKEECDAAGGEFHPIIFNWMVHLYPLEKDSAQSGRSIASTPTDSPAKAEPWSRLCKGPRLIAPAGDIATLIF
jgi:hypothetical protein